MASWDLTAIRKKVRNLTGMQGTSQLTNDELDTYINHYYQYLFPLEVKPRALQGYYELDLTAYTDEYDLDDTFYESYTTLGSLAWMSKGDSGTAETEFYQISTYKEPESFYAIWPMSTEYTESRPSSVLIWENKLLFRTSPDDDYRFKIVAWKRPSALETALDQPIQVEWGPVIATGAALEIVEDQGDSDAMQRIQAFHQKYLNSINSIGTAWLSDRRAKPTF